MTAYSQPDQPEWLTDVLADALQARYGDDLFATADYAQTQPPRVPLADVPQQAAIVAQAAWGPLSQLGFQAESLPLPHPHLLCARAMRTPEREAGVWRRHYIGLLAPLLATARANLAGYWPQMMAQRGHRTWLRALIVWHVPAPWRLRFCATDGDALLFDVLLALLGLPHAALGEVITDVDDAATTPGVDVALWIVDQVVAA